MDAYTVARELLGRALIAQLSAGQLAQLRAIDHEVQQRIFDRLHPADADVREGRRRELTAGAVAELRAVIEAAVLQLLTPEQRSVLAVRSGTPAPPGPATRDS
jgi:hypothetical protein